jgi:hypothetical protein
MSKDQLTERVLTDPQVQIYSCGRRDIQAGLIDRRVLATIEFLSASGLDPYISGLDCGHSVNASTGVDEQGMTGASLDISRINNIPIEGHQGPGSITDIAIRRLLTLQGSMAPDQIISDMSLRGEPSTLALPDHANRIQIVFTPDFGPNRKLAAQVKAILQPGQWVKLIDHISKIPEPVVPMSPSKYAVRVSAAHQSRGPARLVMPLPIRPGRLGSAAQNTRRALPPAAVGRLRSSGSAHGHGLDGSGTVTAPAGTPAPATQRPTRSRGPPGTWSTPTDLLGSGHFP